MYDFAEKISNQYESNVRLYSRSFSDVFETAKGSIIYSKDKKAYLDFFSAAGSLNYGHNHPLMKEDILKYVVRDGITQCLDMHNPPRTLFIKKFQELILKPRQLNYKIMLTGPTGANAVEAALKLARRATNRKLILYCSGSYHGLSLGALSVSDLRETKNKLNIELPHTLMIPYGDQHSSEELLSDLRSQFNSWKNTELPAAIILETVQGEGGLNVPSSEWLKGMVNLAREFETLIIIDDIQTGCGRTGSFFGFEHESIVPDIVCLSKSLSGYGLPLSLLLLKPELDVFSPGEHTGTFRGSPLALISASKAIDFWNDQTFVQSIKDKACYIDQKLNDLTKKYSTNSICKKGLGFLQGLEWDRPDIAARVAKEAFSQGLIIETCGKKHQVLKCMPALTISMNELENGFAIIDTALDRLIKNNFF